MEKLDMNRFSNLRVPMLLSFAAALLLVPMLFIGVFQRDVLAQSNHHHEQVTSDSLQETMRSLWEDHIVWTRLFIVSDIAGLPDKDLTAKRLLQNQVDIGNAIAPYYGQEAADQLSTLLQAHILGAATVLDAAKSGDCAAVETASAAWYANGDEVATFLSSLNPEQWPLQDMKAQMKMHLDLTLAEATARLSGDYSADIAHFDQIRTHILGFADLLSQGIEAQFPSQFS
jgi:hypothetical protein